MTEQVLGKVAQVTSDRELIINKGRADGVTAGMLFRVKGDPIAVTDPDTDEVLGEISSVKVVVKAAEIADRFSIARTFRTRRVNVGGSGANLAIGSLAGMLQPPKYESRVETLRRDPQKGEPMDYADSVVHVGDVVEAVDDGEDIDQTSTTLWR